jgi:PEP-CTERM motif
MRFLYSTSLLSSFVAMAHGFTLTATFDELQEGYSYRTSFSSGGLLFSNLQTNMPDGSGAFVIDAANANTLGSSFTAPNVLTTMGYVPGPGTGWGRFQSMDIALAEPGSDMHSIILDIWTSVSITRGNTVTLAGLRNNVVVSSVTYTPVDELVDHELLSLSGNTYDKFRIYSQGSMHTGVVFASFDNFRVEATPVPEPTALLSIGLGLLAFRYRRYKKEDSQCPNI